MRVKIALLALLAVIGTVAVIFAWQERSERAAEPAPEAAAPPAEPAPEPAPETAAESQFPISLPALAKRHFDGHDLVQGEVLENHPTYTRYFMTYKSSGLTISGIMNIPKGTPPEGGFPVAILNHGHIDTSIYTNGRGLRREQDYLATRGFAVFHSDYRNHAESDKTDEGPLAERIGYVEDVINLVYAVRASDLPVNKEQITMLGHSMGGGVAEAVMVTQPDLVNAYALYAPVSMDYRDSYDQYMKERPETVQAIRESYGLPEDNPDFWDAISPKTYVQNVTRPVRIYQGTADDSVPKEWSIAAEKLLKDAGKDVTLTEYQGEAHEFGPHWNEFMFSVTEFFALRTNKKTALRRSKEK